MKLQTLKDLYIDNLKDLHNAEIQLMKSLPKIARAASSDDLKQCIQEHLEQTRQQIDRLEKIIGEIGATPRGKRCFGMEGIIQECQEVVGMKDSVPSVRDAGLIACVQKAEHYEICGYGTVRTFAQQLDMKDAAKLLDQILVEEKQEDRKLNQIAEKSVNVQAVDTGEVQMRVQHQSSRRSSSRSTRSRDVLSSARGRSRSMRATGSGPRRTSGRRGSEAQVTTDHDEIRRWVEERGGHPACVRGTGNKGDVGLLRIDFPGYTGEQKLQPISWDEFFEKFDEQGLALLFQEKTQGKQSRFSKLINRSSRK